jgi:hypothetical protein
VDRQEQRIDLPPGSSLGQIIEHVCRQGVSADRVITHIRINGQELLEDERGLYPDISGEEIDLLELQTGLSTEMASRGLRDARDYLERLNPAIGETADLFRTGQDAKALEQYGRCMDGLNWFMQILEGAKQVMALDYHQIQSHKVSIQSYVENLQQNIREMWNAQQDEDWVMLSDLLEYELLPLMEGWKEILPLIQAAARHADVGGKGHAATRQ